MSLERIKQPVATELDEFEELFKASMKSNVPLLDKITWYIVQRKGKQVRPMLVLLSARLFGPVNDASYTAASMVELLHTATLVHDDVVDDANERRGFFSINALWKNKIAVLVGDYLLSQGLMLSVQKQQFGMLEIVSRAVREMAEGELLQMEKARRLDIREEVYFDIIRQKTASLIAAACSAGAASTTSDPAIVEKIRLFGEKTGIAFQIRDDLFDFGTDDVGKPLGIDIKEKKMTLPLIYTLAHCDKETRRRILYIVKNESDKKEKVEEVIHIVRNGGGIEYATEAMLRYRQEAFDLLEEVAPDSDARTALRDLVSYVTDRKK
jgi:octaprenyl-diphosphate synthase